MINNLRTVPEQVEISGVVIVSGARNPRAFLIVGGHDTINYIYNTDDDDFERHLREIGGSVYRISDTKLIDAIGNSVFPICGNCYAYVMTISLVGGVSTLNSESVEMLDITKVTSATVVDYDGATIKLDELL